MRFLTILLCSTALLCVATLHGQDQAFSFAIQAGPSFFSAQTDPKEAFDSKFRIGLFAGAQVRWALSDKWGIPVDAQFSRRGYYYNTEGAYIFLDNQPAIYRGRVDYQLNYIDIVPQVEFKPIPVLGIAVGPYLSYRLGESVQYGEVIDWISTNDTEFYKDIDFDGCQWAAYSKSWIKKSDGSRRGGISYLI